MTDSVHILGSYGMPFPKWSDESRGATGPSPRTAAASSVSKKHWQQ